MIPNWTSHLKDPEAAKNFRKHIYNSKGVLERLSQIVDNYVEELDQLEADTNQYDSPSWAALQADRNGYRRAMRRFKKIITLDQKE